MSVDHLIEQMGGEGAQLPPPLDVSEESNQNAEAFAYTSIHHVNKGTIR